MEMIQHIRIGSPLIWVNTLEPERITEIICSVSTKDVYRLDAVNGLVVWRDNTWKTILGEIGSAEAGDLQEAPIHDLGMAIDHVMDAKACFIFENAHQLAEKLIGLFLTAYSKYRTAVLSNNLENIETQFIALSCNDEVPPELVKHFVVCHPGYPTESELTFLSASIFSKDKILFNQDLDLNKVVKAGLGLTEQEFIQVSMLSINERKTVDPEFIAKWKMDRVKQGGILEIRRPKIALKDIGGLDLAKELIDNVVWTWNNPVEAAELDIMPLRRVLFVGIPGTGKSAICEATASTLGLDLAKFGISQMMDKFIGESEKRMRAAFSQIRSMAPLVIWMDELGRDLSVGDYQGDGGTTSRVHGEFLTGIQELPDNVLLMAAANQIGHISPEMLRADRFDKIMFVGLPSLEERIGIFGIHLGADSERFNLQTLAEQSDTFTGAEIKALIREAKFKISVKDKRKVEQNDIESLIPTQQNRMWIKHRETVLDMYKRAIAEWDWASSDQLKDAEIILGGKKTGGKRQPIMTSF
jgi:ATP-dependent 26S proteasome regulatory subunit